MCRLTDCALQPVNVQSVRYQQVLVSVMELCSAEPSVSYSCLAHKEQRWHKDCSEHGRKRSLSFVPSCQGREAANIILAVNNSSECKKLSLAVQQGSNAASPVSQLPSAALQSDSLWQPADSAVNSSMQATRQNRRNNAVSAHIRHLFRSLNTML